MKRKHLTRHQKAVRAGRKGWRKLCKRIGKTKAIRRIKRRLHCR